MPQMSLKPFMAAEKAKGMLEQLGTDLQEAAKRHLWMHFTRMGSFGPDHEVPIIVKGGKTVVH